MDPLRFAWLALGLMACAEEAPNSLEGSLGDFFDLTFDHTRARWFTDELAVEYVDSDRGDLVVLRLVWPHTGEVGTDAEYDLAEAGHVQFSDAIGSQLPPVMDGWLRFEDAAMDAGAVGRFSAVFEPRDEIGLAVRGRFDAPLEVIDAP